MMEKSKVSNNFGKWGWFMILYAGVSYYVSAALSTDGLNFYPAQFEMLHGWNAGLITSLAGVAGWTALVGAVVFAYLIEKTGTKFLLELESVESEI